MTKTRKVAHILGGLVEARLNCQKQPINHTWLKRHEETIKEIVRQVMPSGSGFDNGTTLDLDRSTGDRLVFSTAYHHMTEHGVYDGWTEHDVIVTPSFVYGLHVRVTGRGRNEIKEYISDCFSADLMRELTDEAVATYVPKDKRATVSE